MIPYDGTQKIAPVELFKSAIKNIYGQNQYICNAMQLSPLRVHGQKGAVYYSLSFPTLLEGSPINTHSSTIMLDLKQIKLILDTIRTYLENTVASWAHPLKHIDISYFHVEPDLGNDIRSSKLIPDEDERLVKFNSNDKTLTPLFCATSSFWRGCIRIYRHE